MSLTLRNILKRYFSNCNHSYGTRAEYRSTLNKWERWKPGITLNELNRKEIAEFLDYVFAAASDNNGKNPGRTSNKAREQLRAIMSWAWEQELINALPRFPKPRKQRDVAGRHYLTTSELNSLYFATHKLRRPRGWTAPLSIGKYWRCALERFSGCCSVAAMFEVVGAFGLLELGNQFSNTIPKGVNGSFGRTSQQPF